MQRLRHPVDILDRVLIEVAFDDAVNRTGGRLGMRQEIRFTSPARVHVHSIFPRQFTIHQSPFGHRARHRNRWNVIDHL
jgi:hypothetical protein